MKIFKVLRYILLLGVVIWAGFRLVPHFNDLTKLWELKNMINQGWFFMAIFSQIFQYIGDGWLSQLLLKVVGIHIKMRDTFRIAALNVFAAHLLPIGEAGGVAAAYHFYRKLGVTPEKFIFLTLCWGTLSYILLGLILVVPIFFLPNLPIKININIFLTLLLIALVCVSIFIGRRGLFRQLEKFLGKYSWFKHFSAFVKNRRTYKKLLVDHPGMVFKSFLAGFLYYLSNIGTLAFSFMTFGSSPSLALVVFAYSVSLVLGRITLAPAGIGATEASLILLFLDAGIDSNVTIAAVLLYRLISFWLPIPGGAFSYYSLKKEHNKIDPAIEEIPGL